MKYQKLRRCDPKMKQTLNVNALADFLLVVRHGGFGAASRASGQPKATLSRHVRVLEDSLGLRLIDRDSRAFSLTDEGRLLNARAEGPLADLTEAATALTHDRGPPAGKLRVSCPMMFGHLAMGSIVAAVLRRYPQIQLEVTVEDRWVDLIEEGYDLVIRINPNKSSLLVGRCFHRDELLLVAPAGLTRPMDSKTPVPAVMGVSAPDVQTKRIVDGNLTHDVTLKTVVRLPSPLMVRDAVLAGAGPGILPRMLVSAALKEGRLQDWGRLSDRHIEVWALHTSRRLTSTRVNAFLDVLAEEMPSFMR
ncbi:MAG TPA: LysR family transcriptional regulator [Accumulibacter sp.]|nr:LysR family transcriptional regulator [Accumulibacter sp.]HND79644.1 LysR family transcriptional regulator [Accumulibacter sp.]HNL13366.1 LysR family transcriptional regulator [Accumulibacter sp.]